MRLLLIGCTGFIGRALIPQLLNSGHELIVTSRKKTDPNLPPPIEKKISYVQVDPTLQSSWETEELREALKVSDGVINLLGEPIADKRWTKDQRQKIISSRIDSTKALTLTMNSLKKPPKVFINASAIGYYGTSQNEVFNEESNHGGDFLGLLCKDWEAIAAEKPKATRLIILRIGIVLGEDGGALGKMLPIFRTGLGGPIGSGEQWMSWIHRTDLCNLIIESLQRKSWSGPINAVAPEVISMSDFVNTLGLTLDRPSFLPVPGSILKLILGDGAKIVLEGQNVSSKRLQKLGFKFKYPLLSEALIDIIMKQS